MSLLESLSQEMWTLLSPCSGGACLSCVGGGSEQILSQTADCFWSQGAALGLDTPKMRQEREYCIPWLQELWWVMLQDTGGGFLLGSGGMEPIFLPSLSPWVPWERVEGWDGRQGWAFHRHVKCSGRRLHAWLLPTLVQRGISSCQSGVLSVCPPTQASIKIQAGLNICQSPAAGARAPDADRCPGIQCPCGASQDWSLKCAA